MATERLPQREKFWATAPMVQALHAAETELSTGANYYTDLFLKKESMTGFFSMPLGYKFFYGALHRLHRFEAGHH
jgi:hypothetical protein